MRGPERGVRLNDLRDGLATGGIRCRDCLWYGLCHGPVKATGLGNTADLRRGAEETRTPDVLLAKEVLYQLSYGPKTLRVLGRLALARERSERALRQTRPQPAKPAKGYSGDGPEQRWWAFLDSNQRPLPYQGSALTS